MHYHASTPGARDEALLLRPLRQHGLFRERRLRALRPPSRLPAAWQCADLARTGRGRGLAEPGATRRDLSLLRQCPIRCLQLAAAGRARWPGLLRRLPAQRDHSPHRRADEPGALADHRAGQEAPLLFADAAWPAAGDARRRPGPWPRLPLSRRRRRATAARHDRHENGIITIALAEADDAEREQRRTQMGEPYRTLLGHFRHEIGHHYWDLIVDGHPSLERFRALFGDERADYGLALQSYYATGPCRAGTTPISAPMPPPIPGRTSPRPSPIICTSSTRWRWRRPSACAPGRAPATTTSPSRP